MSHTPEITLQPSRLKQIHNLPAVVYQVIHTTIGRFRINIPRLSQDSDYARQLEQLVKSLKFVTDVRISSLTSSVIVNYDAIQVSLDHARAMLVEAIQQSGQATASFWEMPCRPEANNRLEERAAFVQPISSKVLVVKPPADKMVWLTWLALYPLVTGVSLLFEPWLILLSLPLRTLFVTGLVVFLMTYLVMPALVELFDEWLYAN